MEFAEKGIVACKAALMGDLSAYSAIVDASGPRLTKRLGRQITPWHQPSWDAVVCEVAVAVLLSKFDGVPSLGDRLVGTGRRILAEATSHDPVWGTGSPRGSGTLPSAWRGRNLLGCALMRVRSILRGQRRATYLRAGEGSLPTPLGDAALATPVDMLPPSMRPLARSLRPTEAIFDRGGGGRCGPNSLAYLFLALGRGCGDSDVLRAEVIAHARQCLSTRPPFALTEFTCDGSGGGGGAGASLATHLTESMRAWPAAARCGLPVSVDFWIELMARPTTWIDEPFLRLCAQLKKVEIEYRAVAADGARARGGVIRPPPSHAATARVVLALWVQQHYAAIMRVVDAPEPAPVDLIGGGGSVGFTTQGHDLWLVPAASHPTAVETEEWDVPVAWDGASLLAIPAAPDSPDPSSGPPRGEPAVRPPAKRAWAGGIHSNALRALRDMLRRKAREGVALTVDQRAVSDALARWDEGAPAPGDTTLLAPFRLPPAGAPPLGRASPVAGESTPIRAEEAPLSPRRGCGTSLAQVLALLDGPNPPTVLVGMEFSGAVRAALEALGLVALSVDVRPSDDGGLHYQGDVRDVLALRPGHWQALYFFLNCTARQPKAGGGKAKAKGGRPTNAALLAKEAPAAERIIATMFGARLPQGPKPSPAFTADLKKWTYTGIAACMRVFMGVG